MKSAFTPIALAGGILLAGLFAGNISACPFARGKALVNTANLAKFDGNKLAIGTAVGAGALAFAGILAYRSRKTAQPATEVETRIPTAFPIPIPPSAVSPSGEEEAVETSNLL